MKLPTTVKATALRKTYNLIKRDPENNLPKVLDVLGTFMPHEKLDAQLDVITQEIKKPNSTWNRYFMDLFHDIDESVLDSIFENTVINSTIKWADVNDDLQAEHDCNIPWAILMDPTSACNLQCTGCWAAEYGDKLNMSYEELTKIVNEAKDIGVHFFLFSGGEPLVRKNDIIRLCEENPDCQFVAFTNGTLIDEEFAEDMLRVKNFIPAISVEGFEADTDFRRGNGTFAQVENAIEILKNKKLPFGVSCCYTSQNAEIIGSEEYFDQMVEWGAKFCWFFTYMPVGNGASPELMATAEQRKYLYEQVRKFRATKPIFTIDFWNDAEFCNGCIAGGNKYLHINANGDMEPCAFVHYSDSNIRDKSLLEALKSPLFKAYREGQPFNENHLRPCPVLDNPECIMDMVNNSGAKSTDLQNPERPEELAKKCLNAAVRWAPVADGIWQEIEEPVRYEKIGG